MRTLVIVGAGFSGTMTAVHVLRRSLQSPSPYARVVLFERTGRFTAGVAYGTDHAAHTLNVPAGRMSAFDDDPEHFLRWARTRDPAVHGGAFVPRRLYGEYLASLLRDTEAAVSASGSPVALERVAEQAVGVEPAAGARVERGLDDCPPGRWIVAGSSGKRIEAEDVVLAIGNFPPSEPCAIDPAVLADGRYYADPWAPGATDVDPEQPVVLIGTGLTMLDIAMSLRSKGHAGAIWGISRRGLTPQAHRDSATPPRAHPRPSDIERWPRTAKGLLNALRREVTLASEQGVDWREVVTSIRHDTPLLWRSLDEREKRRFLRYLRPFWETHRHRSSPETAARIDRMVGEGQLRVVAGRLREIVQDGPMVGVRYSPRGEPERVVEQRAARVINCTGPDTDLSRVREPLIVNLRQNGLLRPDVLGLGLDTTEQGELVAADGRTLVGVHVLGPLRKGLLWENTAVPELRGEADRLAGRLCGALSVRVVHSAGRVLTH